MSTVAGAPGMRSGRIGSHQWLDSWRFVGSENLTRLDVLAREQARLTAEISHAHGLIRAAETKVEDEERVIEQAIDLMADWEDTYRRADPDIRRRLNQVFFVKLLVDDTGEITEHRWSDAYEGLRAPDLPGRIDAELAALEEAAHPTCFSQARVRVMVIGGLG